MPYIELPDELAEALADMLGIYRQKLRFVGWTIEDSVAHDDWDVAHADDCGCRACWTAAIARRIRASVANEQALHGKED